MKVIKLCAGLLLVLSASLQAQPKCTNANLNGTLFYTISGSIKNGAATVSYTELGQVTADGAGSFSSGTTTTSTAGVIATLPVTGTYSVNANCSGTATLITSVQTVTVSLQVVNGGGLTLSSITSSPLNELGQIRFFRAANATGAQCGNGSISGAHGLLLSGGTYSGGVRTPYEAEVQFVVDGNGAITALTGQVTTASANGSLGFNGTGTYSLSSNCSGTAQINLANGASSLNYVIARAEGGNILFLETDLNTTVSGSAQAQLLQDVLPQFVFGGGWYTALYFSNPTSSTVSFLVTFTTDNGTPMSVPGVGTTKLVTLAANSSTIIEAQNVGALVQGFASFALPTGVTGYAVFRQTVAGRPDQEALVGFKAATETATSLIWDDTNFVTSVAILNSSAVATTVTITVWDNSGNVIGTSLQSVGAGQKIANQMHLFQNLSGMTGLRGHALFSVPSGNVSVLGLRFAGSGAFTSIPTVQEQ